MFDFFLARDIWFEKDFSVSRWAWRLWNALYCLPLFYYGFGFLIVFFVFIVVVASLWIFLSLRITFDFRFLFSIFFLSISPMSLSEGKVYTLAAAGLTGDMLASFSIRAPMSLSFLLFLAFLDNFMLCSGSFVNYMHHIYTFISYSG